MASKKERKAPPKRPARFKWEFDPDIPTEDLLEGRDLRPEGDLQEIVDDFISMMEHDDYLAWEAVVCSEQELPLTKAQKKALGKLLSFSDDEEDRVLYIDEIARPSEPWYETLSKIVPHLVIEPYKTCEALDDVQCEGWGRLTHCLNEHGKHLSLPSGVTTPLEVVPVELRHKLWLQWCFNELGGLGQSETLTLQNEEEHDRIEGFIECLRRCKESVQYFDLTLDAVLTRVFLPEREEPMFVRVMQEKLGLKSTQDRLADYL
jgi:hypothetical protein